MLSIADVMAPRLPKAAGIEMSAFPREWLQLLNLLALHFPEVVLGGGAVRDHLCGRPVKDLDFWVNAHDFIHDHDYLVANFKAKLKDTLDPDDVSLPSAAHEIDSIMTFEWKGWPVEVVILHKPVIEQIHDIVSTFDIGLCQCGVNQSGEVYVSLDFVRDYHAKVLRAVLPNTPNSTWQRLQRIRKKYPDFTVDLGPIGEKFPPKKACDFEVVEQK